MQTQTTATLLQCDKKMYCYFQYTMNKHNNTHNATKFDSVTKKCIAISSTQWTNTIIHTMQQNLPCSHFYLKKKH